MTGTTGYREIKPSDFKAVEHEYAQGYGAYIIGRRLGIKPTHIEAYLNKTGLRRSHKEAMRIKRERFARTEHLPKWMR